MTANPLERHLHALPGQHTREVTEPVGVVAPGTKNLFQSDAFGAPASNDPR